MPARHKAAMHGRANANDLLTGGARFAAAPGLLARLLTPAARRVLASVDRGLVRGSIDGRLPDGTPIRLGGRAPGHDCIVHLNSWRALLRLATSGSIGWYQAWEAGEWSSPDPVALFALFVDNARALGDTGRAKGPWRWLAQMAHRAKRNTRAQAARNIHAHYDLGNAFYAQWLDPSMTYSSGYDLAADGDLAASQRRKWQRLSARIGAAETVLEIGCGWGSLAGHLAGEGSHVTGISLSEEQLAWARDRYAGPHFEKRDYRDQSGQFDAIVSVEMVEALGREYWPAFMDCVARNLKPGGRAAIQYIAMADELFDAYAASADFIQAYVFPGGMLIRASEFRRLAEARGLTWEDQEDFGPDYAETLRLWRDRFDAAVAEGRLPAGFDERFVRLWRYYLMYCEGGFRGGAITVSQVTLVKGEQE